MTGLAVMFRVDGLPIPQGHVRTVTKGGRTWSFHGSPGLPAWRALVADAARTAVLGRPGPFQGAAQVALVFHLPRPKNHWTSKGTLKPWAPRWPTTRPDVDRLARAVLDAISLGDPPPVLGDDSLVVSLEAGKVYCAWGEPPGVTVFACDADSADTWWRPWPFPQAGVG